MDPAILIESQKHRMRADPIARSAKQRRPEPSQAMMRTQMGE